MKTINDIVREMRKRFEPYAKSDSNDARYVAYLGYAEFADRIEAAVVRENRTSKEFRQVGNAATMREALEVARRTLKLVYENAVEFIQPRLADEIIHAGLAIESALAAPPRNCDLYSKDEVRLAYHLHGDGLMTMQAFAEWLYAEAKGETK